MRKGFTLVELLVALLIVSLVLGAAYITYINILGGFGRETASAETQIETAVSLDILRLDIEHAGYGLGEDITDLPIESDNESSLAVRSVINTTRLIKDSSGEPVMWALVECSSAGVSPSPVAGDSITALPSDAGLVFLGASNRHFIGNRANRTCPDAGVFVAVPYDTKVASGCTDQFCNKVRYYLSTNQTLDTCNPNTRNLLRAVGGGTGMPLLSCVADIKFLFDIDRNGDGVVDIKGGEFKDADINGDGVVSAEEVRRALKGIHVYILVQDGRKDKDFTFTNYTTCASGPCLIEDTNVELYLPPGFENYRWKVVKLAVRPMNL